MSSGPKPAEKSIVEAANKPLLNALWRKPVPHAPIWLMRQAGRYLPEYREVRAKAGGFLELCFDPKLACEVTVQPVRRFGLDAAILFSDILVVPLGLGQAVRFTEGEGPALDPIVDERGLKALDTVRLHERLAPVYETVARVAEVLPKETALIGFAGAPWTVASYMIEGGTSRDFSIVKAWAFRNPHLFNRLLSLLVDATAAYLIRQVEAGAEVLQIFDSWAGALAETEFTAWSIDPITEIVRRVKANHPSVPIIGFPRGCGHGYKPFVEATGVNGIGLDPSVPLDWAVRELQRRVTLQGNLDPSLLLVGGDAMRREAMRILDAWGQASFIFNLGHGVMQPTPPEHVAELVKIVHGWRR